MVYTLRYRRKNYRLRVPGNTPGAGLYLTDLVYAKKLIKDK
jgi:hypothetical protein